jgi:putative phage-type endonuclease
MNRQVHNLVQGSPEWHAYRATPNLFNASDAPAMLGESPYKSRDELLREYATGVRHDVDARTQKLFDDGHRFEEEDRPRAEELIGQELFPATVSVGFERFTLSASLDGWTMDEEIIYEHKTLNNTIELNAAQGDIALVHKIQMEQQLFCSGATKALFRASRGSQTESPVSIWYQSDIGLQNRLLSGWQQFFIDLENYEAPEPSAPKPVAAPVASLPMVNYKIDFDNGLSVTSNLEPFKEAARQLVEQSKVILVTDQDFEDAKARVKECEKAEANIKSLIDRMLGELGDVNTFKSDLENIGVFIKQSRLNQKKQIDTRSTERKAEIIGGARAAAKAHIDSLNKKISPVLMPVITADFDAAIYRKSSFDSMQSAVNDALANFIIDANIACEKIEVAISTYKNDAADYEFLFNDLQQLVSKDIESLKAIIAQRIGAHKAEDQRKIEARAQEIAEQNRVAELVRKDLESGNTIAFIHPEQTQLTKEEWAAADKKIADIAYTESVSRSNSDNSGVFTGEIHDLSGNKVAASHLTSPIEEAIRDFETLHGLVPALARSIVKAIYDGQHRHITFKN